MLIYYRQITVTFGNGQIASAVAASSTQIVSTWTNPCNTGQQNAMVHAHGVSSGQEKIVTCLANPILSESVSVKLASNAVKVEIRGDHWSPWGPHSLTFPSSPGVTGGACDTSTVWTGRMVCAISHSQPLSTGVLPARFEIHQVLTSVANIATVVGPPALIASASTRISQMASKVTVSGTNIDLITDSVFSGTGAGTPAVTASDDKMYPGVVNGVMVQVVGITGTLALGPLFFTCSGNYGPAGTPVQIGTVVAPHTVTATPNIKIANHESVIISIHGTGFFASTSISLKGSGIELPGGFKGGPPATEAEVGPTAVPSSEVVTIANSQLRAAGYTTPWKHGDIEATVTQDGYKYATFVKVGTLVPAATLFIPFVQQRPRIGQSAPVLTVIGENFALEADQPMSVAITASAPYSHQPVAVVATPQSGGTYHQAVYTLNPGSVKLPLGALSVAVTVYGYTTLTGAIVTVVEDPVVSASSAEITVTATTVTVRGQHFESGTIGANTLVLSGAGAGTAQFAPTTTNSDDLAVFTLASGKLGVGPLLAVFHCHSSSSGTPVQIAVVKGVAPSVPRSVRTATVGATLVSLVWDAPLDGGGYTVTDYEIWHTVAGTASKLVSVSGTSYDLQNLTPDTVYTYTVRAVNPDGISTDSNVVSVKTLPAGTVQGMAAPLVSSIVPDGMTLAWSPPLDPGGSTILRYEVFIDHAAPNTQVDIKVASLLPSQRSYVIRSLQPSKQYRVKVRCISSSVPSPQVDSPVVQVNTLAPSAPYPVPLPAFAAIYTRTAFMTWEAPFSTGGSPITGYKVYRITASTAGTSGGGQRLLQSTGSTSTVIASLEADSRSYVITGLQPQTQYTYVVSAVNVYGESDRSNVASVTTAAPTKPSAPAAPSVSQPGPSSLTLLVPEPQDDGGSPITGYVLYYGVGSGGGSLNQTMSASNPLFTVTGLTANTEYQFQGAAININGTSSRSPITTARTAIGETITAVLPDNGPAQSNGTVVTVTLQGRYFGEVASDLLEVRIGSRACTTSVWRSSQEVLCQGTPDHPLGGASLVHVKTKSALWSSVYPVIYGYNRPGYPGPPPIVDSITPKEGTAIGGTMVTFTGKYFLSVSNLEVMSLAGVICNNITLVNPTSASCVTAPGPIGTVGRAEVVTLDGGSSITVEQATTPQGTVPSSVDPAAVAAVTWRYTNPRPVVDNVRPKIVTDVGGDAVVVRGKYFGETTPADLQVSIDGRPCLQSTWLSSEEVSCTVPPARNGVQYGLSKAVFTVSHSGLTSGQHSLAFGYGPVCTVPCLAWDAYCLGDQCTCAPGFVGPPACNTSLISVDVQGPHHLSENGQASKLVVTLAAKPSSNVNILLSSSDPTEGRPEPIELTFTASDFDNDETASKSVSVVPWRDTERDGNVTFAINIAATSQDPRFHEFGIGSVSFVNEDALPEIMGVYPSMVPLKGGVITITASEIDERVLAYMVTPKERKALRRLERPPASNDTQTAAATRASPSLSLLQQQSTAAVAPVILYYQVPPVAAGGYASLELVNNNGGRIVLSRGIYSSDDCPMPGMFGRGADCIACPEGAVCPGGYRMWPRPGYWTEAEASGWVKQCDPPEYCVSWQQDQGSVQCMEGQSGFMCSDCAKNYYPVGDACVLCPSASEILLYVGCDIALWASVCLAAWFMKSDENFQRIIGFVVVIQTMGGVGTMASSALPNSLLVVYDALHLFMADYEVTKPDCSDSPPTYALKYGQNLAYNLLIGFGLLSGACLLRYLVPAYRRWRGRSEDEVEGARSFYSNRLTRILCVWISVAYFSLTRKALEALYCDRYGDSLHIVPSPENQCFTTGHTMVFLASLVIVVVMTFGWPVFTVYWLRRNRHQLMQPKFMARWGTNYGLFKPQFQMYFGLLVYLKLLMLAIAESFFTTLPTARFVILLSLFGLSVGAVFRMAPHESAIDDWVHIFVDAWEILALMVNFLGTSGTLSEHSKKSLALTVIVLMACVLLVLILDLGYHLVFSPALRSIITLSSNLRSKSHHDPDARSSDGESMQALDELPLLQRASEGWLMQSLSRSLGKGVGQEPGASSKSIDPGEIKLDIDMDSLDSQRAITALAADGTRPAPKSIPGVILYQECDEDAAKDPTKTTVTFTRVTLLCNLPPWRVGDKFEKAEMDKSQPIIRIFQSESPHLYDDDDAADTLPESKVWEYSVAPSGQPLDTRRQDRYDAASDNWTRPGDSYDGDQASRVTDDRTPYSADGSRGSQGRMSSDWSR
eukprot:TRINITY_DN3319_c0_g1_i2.p1 TRINITY_DN3319_c0_g1~~TRINITY_DN3319_c0_g1_i2.p1  ORF type:complete len:2244 (-),score=420.27 TRINITY_DN3319_c0_g1_i2:218-6949(-)